MGSLTGRQETSPEVTDPQICRELTVYQQVEQEANPQPIHAVHCGLETASPGRWTVFQQPDEEME